MLKELKIEGFKLLRDIHITPHNGFNVLTGETGAGKSLLIGALRFLLGAPGGDELFAKGEDLVKVSATFLLPKSGVLTQKLIDDGIIEIDETEIHIERWKERDGRSRFFIGGRRANLPAIIEFRDSMIDFLEQHQASRIAERPALDILDQLGDKSHQQKLEDVEKTHSQWLLYKNELIEKERKLRELAERRDLIQFQLKELTEAELIPGELENLTKEHQLLAGAKELRENAESAKILLDGDEMESVGAGDVIANVIDLLESLAKIDPDWASRLDELSSAQETIREIARELASTIDNLQDDPARLDELDRRIALLEKLKRKYHLDHDALIAFRDELERDFGSINTADEDIEELRKKVKSSHEAWLAKAQQLSSSRKKLAKKIEKELKSHLADLELPHSRVVFKFENRSDKEPSQKGMDSVELMLSTVSAEEIRPIAKVASGGEATRISLALKTLWAQNEGIPILVLDEGDIGIGGDTAYRVGEKFLELASTHQLIVVSHLAQVAAMAHRHYTVTKTDSSGKGEINIVEVKGEAREKELARMLGGTVSLAKSLALARSMLKEIKEKTESGTS